MSHCNLVHINGAFCIHILIELIKFFKSITHTYTFYYVNDIEPYVYVCVCARIHIKVID